jgi:hypothetical protein
MNKNTDKTMKEILKLLYQGKKPEQQPIKLEIKLKSTAMPDEHVDINKWHELIHKMNDKRN